jgi:hypothetical protein
MRPVVVDVAAPAAEVEADAVEEAEDVEEEDAHQLI